MEDYKKQATQNPSPEKQATQNRLLEMKLQLYMRFAASPVQSRYAATAIVIDMANQVRKEEKEKNSTYLCSVEYQVLYKYLNDMAKNIQRAYTTPAEMTKMLELALERQHKEVLELGVQKTNSMLQESTYTAVRNRLGNQRD